MTIKNRIRRLVQWRFSFKLTCLAPFNNDLLNELPQVLLMSLC
ncbi:Uncharacterised protein [Serratia marcescens]|uniref:Uncharacterized protein n=1 Tax=Serratia marcescens TaxID=615 RepID=A0A379ZKG5_SERMA|nr:Uncharacterised protein [Serratia marcescens]